MDKTKNSKKVVIRLTGGLGNQLHQYSYGLIIAEKIGAKIYIDKEFLENYSRKLNITFRNIAINKFDIKIDTYKSLLSNHLFLFICKKIKFISLLLKFFKTKVIFERLLSDEFNINDYNLIYLDGVLGNYSDYVNNKNLLLNTFIISPIFFDLKTYINNVIPITNSVSIHIRRTDYLKSGSIHEVLDISYYSKAIEYIKSKINNPIFYIFSDDKEFIEKIFSTNETKILNHSFEDKDFFDFLAISRCQHHIIANSTFSWWAAFLNTNKEGITIAPSKILKNSILDIDQNYPCDWIVFN